jgi:hypothetical protein
VRSTIFDIKGSPIFHGAEICGMAQRRQPDNVIRATKRRRGSTSLAAGAVRLGLTRPLGDK